METHPESFPSPNNDQLYSVYAASRQLDTISLALDIFNTMTASVEFMILDKLVIINTKAVLQALFFKMLEFYQFVQSDLLSQIGWNKTSELQAEAEVGQA